MTDETKTVTLLKVSNIAPCCRCNQAHLDGLFFTPFKRPVLDDYKNIQYTHWALCPVTNEPLLVAILPPAPEKPPVPVPVPAPNPVAEALKSFEPFRKKPDEAA